MRDCGRLGRRIRCVGFAPEQPGQMFTSWRFRAAGKTGFCSIGAGGHGKFWSGGAAGDGLASVGGAKTEKELAGFSSFAAGPGCSLGLGGRHRQGGSEVESHAYHLNGGFFVESRRNGRPIGHVHPRLAQRRTEAASWCLRSATRVGRQMLPGILLVELAQKKKFSRSLLYFPSRRD